MSSTPLLHGGTLPGPVVLQDHPIFLRASHSPWKCIPQNVLVFLRGSVLGYIVATAVMTGHFKLTEESEAAGLTNAFDFSVVSSVMVFLYHVITFCWTYTHLYYPEPAQVEGTIERSIIRAMSLPRNLASKRKQFYFSLFYHAATVFCFMNTTIYWFITRQHDASGGGEEASARAADLGQGNANVTLAGPIPDAPFSDLFGEGWFKPFILLNLYGVNSVVMVFESLFLNSIKRPVAIGSTLLSLMVMSGLYLGWGVAGKFATGEFPFFWMDEAQAGSKEAVSVYCTGFVLLAPLMFTLMQGFVGIREGLTRSRPESRVVHEPLES